MTDFFRHRASTFFEIASLSGVQRDSEFFQASISEVRFSAPAIIAMIDPSVRN